MFKKATMITAWNDVTNNRGQFDFRKSHLNSSEHKKEVLKCLGAGASTEFEKEEYAIKKK